MPHYGKGPGKTGVERAITGQRSGGKQIPLAPTPRDVHARRAACAETLADHGLTRRPGDGHQRADGGHIFWQRTAAVRAYRQVSSVH